MYIWLPFEAPLLYIEIVTGCVEKRGVGNLKVKRRIL
jgi:hypothetical protein